MKKRQWTAGSRELCMAALIVASLTACGDDSGNNMDTPASASAAAGEALPADAVESSEYLALASTIAMEEAQRGQPLADFSAPGDLVPGWSLSEGNEFPGAHGALGFAAKDPGPGTVANLWTDVACGGPLRARPANGCGLYVSMNHAVNPVARPIEQLE